MVLIPTPSHRPARLSALGQLVAAVLAAILLSGFALPMCAQPSPSYASRWLSESEPVPDLVVPKTLPAWEATRQSVRSRLWQLLGRLPPRPAVPQVRVLSREDKGDYLLEYFQFDNGAGATVPGYLFLPQNGADKHPAILYCHWHGGEYEKGKEELLRADHTPAPPGPAFAAAGYAVLGIDAYCFGERNGQGPGGPGEKGTAGEMTASKFNLWVGRTLWGMMLRDDLMALDYLSARPEVDTNRLGVTGISMGATRSWWLMALDDRLRAGSAVACLTRYQALIAQEGLRYHGIYYFVPGLLNHFDTESIVALAAPRALLFQTGDRDEGSPALGVRTIEEKVKPVYRLYQAEARFQSILYPGVGHEYRPEMWLKTFRWFETNLRD